MKRALPVTLLLATLAVSVYAVPSVTVAGAGLGFTISTFASGFTSLGPYGPFGVTTTPNGNVLVSNYGNQTRYVFKRCGRPDARDSHLHDLKQ